MDITIRVVGPDPDEAAARRFQRPLDYAFMSAIDPGELEAYRATMEPERFINAFDGETAVGAAGAYSFRLTVPGGRDIGAAGITAVGVMASHRRRGILRQMLTWLMDQARERGEPVAILQASEAAIYRRFGFGHAVLMSRFEFERSRAAFIDPIDIDAIGQVRFLELDEAMAVIPALYESHRLAVPGALDRSEEDWRHLSLGPEPWNKEEGQKHRVVLEGPDGVRGYATFWVKPDWTDRGPNGRMRVFEVIATDPAAEQALWQWLCGYDLIGTITTYRGPVPHPLELWLLEPRRLGLTIRDNVFLRFLDLQAALVGRGYAGSGELVLDVADPMIDSNAGRWRLSIGDGEATVTRTTDDADLALAIDTLASTYLGAYRWADLAAAGLVRELVPGAITRADTLFTAGRSPWCSTPF